MTKKITWQLCKSLIEKGKPLPKIDLNNYDQKLTFYGFMFSYRGGDCNPNIEDKQLEYLLTGLAVTEEYVRKHIKEYKPYAKDNL